MSIVFKISSQISTFPTKSDRSSQKLRHISPVFQRKKLLLKLWILPLFYGNAPQKRPPQRLILFLQSKLLLRKNHIPAQHTNALSGMKQRLTALFVIDHPVLIGKPVGKMTRSSRISLSGVICAKRSLPESSRKRTNPRWR